MESEQGGDEKNLVSDSGDDKGDGLTEKTPILFLAAFYPAL
jgi:hypothetical protein